MNVSEAAVERRKARGTYDGLCADCRNGRANEIKYNGTVCRPWRGEVDEDFNPIDRNLKLYLPGLRTCGHKDCVNKEHIRRTPQPLELERNDISYRTGRLSELQDYLQELSA
ncbi:hypothetical protein UFOVP692_40 [uncultured Caudovirales phage]|jgi:hypothetical protein|uniref:Uncharacterized protein n=1 Tax=uncultured Caudovirales phage TaxID=2100421 RepID=A0A6J5NEW3_9CAUD|nr:hypothetical protein UFOVP692_40 [uncultured Caudovirales phage]